MIETLIGTMIGKEMFAQALTESTKSIYSEIGFLLNYKDYNFKELLENLDINNKIEIITSLITDLEYDNKMYSDTCKKNIHSLIDIINKIKNEIKEIKNDIEQHEQKWFYKYRSNTYNNKINNLVNHTKIMENRLDIFIKIINLNK